MMQQTVSVRDEPQIVTVHRWSNRVWLATAEYMGSQIDAAGASAELALHRWCEAATSRSDQAEGDAGLRVPIAVGG